MWILGKPLLDDALSDIDKIIKAAGKNLNASLKPRMQYVVRLYDKNNGSIDSSELSRFTPVEEDMVHGMYKTKTYEGQDLYYIRKELFHGIDLCPLCGINPPSQLDHQMPKTDYKPLSLCRLNLVPVCGVCNNKKNAKPYNEFIHPYYAEFPKDKVFMIANIHVNIKEHKFSWYYSIDYSQLPQNSVLIKKIQKQVVNIKLLRRLMKESHRFVADILIGASFNNQKALKDYLRIQFNSYLSRYGRNDWRTAILYGLFMSDKIGIKEIEWYIGRTKQINGGYNI